MKIELLYVPNCPNHAPALLMLRDVLSEQGMAEDVKEIEVSDPAQAAAASFLGSPTIRIDGRDVEPRIPDSVHHGLSCRAYLVDGRRQGVPRREWISEAILSAHRGGEGMGESRS